MKVPVYIDEFFQIRFRNEILSSYIAEVKQRSERSNNTRRDMAFNCCNVNLSRRSIMTTALRLRESIPSSDLWNRLLSTVWSHDRLEIDVDLWKEPLSWFYTTAVSCLRNTTCSKLASPSIYIPEYPFCSLWPFIILLINICLHPFNQMVFERSFYELMEEVGSE